MRYSVVFQGIASLASGPPSDRQLTDALDHMMEKLGAVDDADSAIGSTGTDRAVEVELIVEATGLADALARAGALIEQATPEGPISIEWVGARGERAARIEA